MPHCHFSTDSFSSITFIAKAISALQSRLLGDKNQWTSTVMTWSRLQRELAHKRTTVNTPTTAVGLTTDREEGRRSEEEEKCNVESRKSTGGQIEASGNGRQRSVAQNGAQTLEKKRKRDGEGDEEERRAAGQVEKERMSERERRREGEEERGMDLEFSSCRKNGVISGTDFSDRAHATPGLDHNVDSTMKRMDDAVKDAAVESVENGNLFFSFF